MLKNRFWLAACLAPFCATPALASPVAEAAAASASAGTSAVSQTQDSDGGGWEFAVTPYLWVAGTSGDLELAEGEGVDIDTSFTELLADLKFAFMGAFEARHDRLVLLGDVIYLSIGTEAKGPLGFVDAQVDPALFVGTFSGGYRVVDQGPLYFDLFAGARVTSLDVEVELTGPMQSIERDKSRTSVSPVVGARFRAPLGDRWGIGLYGDLAGFGVTSDLTWQLLGTVQYDLSRHWRFSAGYRHVSIHQDKSDFEVDVALSGPILGFSYRF